MDEKIDHAALAAKFLRAETLTEIGLRDEHAIPLMISAQAHATLALVEQQRIANLIALSMSHPGSANSWDQPVYELVAEAQNALCGWEMGSGSQIGGPDEYPVIRPDIRRGLGL